MAQILSAESSIMNGNIRTVASSLHGCSGAGRWKRSLFAMLAVAAAGWAADVARFAGTWIPDRNQGSVIDSAIVGFVSHLPAEELETSKERLEAVNQPIGKLCITVVDSGRKVEFGYDGRSGLAVPVDGSSTQIKGGSGEAVQLRVAMEAGKLLEAYQAQDGKRTNRYALSPDGKTMIMEVKVESPHMPMPLEYKVAFARK